MSQHAREASPRIRLRWGRISAALVMIALAAYVAVCAFAPIPNPEVELGVPPQQSVVSDDAQVQDLVAEFEAPTAVGWQDGEEVWANSEEAAPIASISKLITALVALEAQPLDPGEEGSTHVWSESDAAQQAEYLAADGIVFPIPVGTEITERQMLTLALLPSANDFATAYAYSVFGDNDAFVQAVDDWKARHGLDSLTIVEPSGMNPRNSASPADLVRIGRLALENPTITEFTGTESAEIPWGIGTVENTNPLLGSLPGTLGLKTGFSGAAGYNLLAAQRGELGIEESGPREVARIAVTLGRPSEEARAAETRAVLLSLDALGERAELVKDREVIGVATTVDGVEIELLADGSADALLVPGETASSAVEVEPVSVGPAGQAVGAIKVSTPTGDASIPVVTGAEIVKPGFWWRLTHPGKLFG